MKFTGTTAIFASVAYLASLVSADPLVSITSPLINTQYKAGSDAIISWINPTVSAISQIVLAKGQSNALQPLVNIATNVNAADMKYIWKIPLDIENGDDYAFELGTSPNLTFAGPFSITGGVNNPASAAVTPASGGSPASSTTSGGKTSQVSPHNASSSHASAGTKKTAGQTVVALGMIAAIASQFF